MGKTIEIRPVPNKYRLNGDERLNVFKGRIIRAAVDTTTGRYKTGLTPKEAEKYGKMLNVDLSDTYIPGKAHPFWDSKIGTLRLGNYTVVLDVDNPLNYIRFKMAKEHPWVAPSLEAYKRGEYPNAWFYIVDEDAKVAEKAKELEKKKKAFELLDKLTDEEKEQIALLLHDSYPKGGMTKDKAKAAINDIIEEDADKFIKLVEKDEKYRTIASLVIKAIGLKVITRKSSTGAYRIGSSELGLTKEDVIAALLDDKNEKLYTLVIEKVKAKEDK